MTKYVIVSNTNSAIVSGTMGRLMMAPISITDMNFVFVCRDLYAAQAIAKHFNGKVVAIEAKAIA